MTVHPRETLVSDVMVFDEELIVAELARLGVSYLSRRISAGDFPDTPSIGRSDLLAAIVRQPSARVRAATISLLLAQPGSWQYVEGALAQLRPKHRITLMLFYSAAVQLQQLHDSELRRTLGRAWEPLPDLFSHDLGLDDAVSPESRLAGIASSHRSWTGSRLNWEGTYRQAADRLLRQWVLEVQWSR